MEIQEGGGVFGRGNPGERGGGGGSTDPGNPGGWGVKKPCHPSGGVDFFWNNPIHNYSK